ncbi:MAG: DUF4344 domain-containing metallopeptidase, partial [Rhodospirillaceae bacterium]
MKLKILIFLAAWLAYAPGAFSLTPEERHQSRTFVTGNVVFTLLHEAGHALIHMLDLPTLGREEDAADNLAALRMIGDPAKGGNEDFIFAAADGWA